MNWTVNDPTPKETTLTVISGNTLHLSRNEVESLCTRAARGAGMSWGLAEEAGHAAGWLVTHGIDGVDMLARHLRRAQGKSWKEVCPVVKAGAWLALSTDLALCPIALGATLSDHLGVDKALFNGHGLHVGMVSTPALVLPFLAMAASAQEHVICVQLHEHAVRIDTRGCISGHVSTLLCAEFATLHISVDSQVSRQGSSLIPRPMASSPINADAMQFLQKLSLRTTVPSSAASRANAGAMGSDND